MEEWASMLGWADMARWAEVVDEIEKWVSNSLELLNLI
jgi:hypothetical protein